MNCPICNLKLKPGTFEIGENRQTIFSCHICNDFYNKLGVSLKPPLSLTAKNS